MGNPIIQRLDWATWLARTEQDRIPEQSLYIWDKNLYGRTMLDNTHDIKFDLLFGNNYCVVFDQPFEVLKSIETKLATGLYIVCGNNHKTTEIYFYDGNKQWNIITTDNSNDNDFTVPVDNYVQSVNGVAPIDGALTLTAAQIMVDNNFDTSVAERLGELVSDVVGLNTRVTTLEQNGDTSGLTLDQAHQVYGAEDQSLFKDGNLHINGYYEGKIDGGGW